LAHAHLFRWLGIDIDHAERAYEMPLSVGGGFEPTRVFDAELRLRAPTDGQADSVPCRLQLGARRRWRLPFAVWLGQGGWIDRFPTRIDRATSTIET
jgi:hypothetical protein